MTNDDLRRRQRLLRRKRDAPFEDGPSEAAIKRAMQEIADAWNAIDPAHHYTVHDPAHPTPGATVVWAATPPSESADESDRRGSRRS